MTKVKIQLYPESRGYEVRIFSNKEDAELFCKENIDAEIIE